MIEVLSDRAANALSLRKNALPVALVGILLLLGVTIEAVANEYVQYISLLILVNIVLATSLNLVNGFTGQFSLGHAGFMAVGAYVSAYLAQHPLLSTIAQSWWLYLLLPLISGFFAALAGLAVGLPSLRLKGDYLAIVTLGFGEIIRVVLLNTEAVGGARGMYGIAGAPVLLNGGVSSFVSQFWVSGIWMILSVVAIWRIAYSARGKAFMAVRDDETAAESMGVRVTYTKVLAFVISAFFAGVGGSLFAHSVKYLNPSTFQFTKSVDIIIMLVLGGLGSITGSIIAAVIITVLPELVLRELQSLTGVDLRMVIYSALLIAVMIGRPSGLFGNRELFQVIRNFKDRWVKTERLNA